jgi:hypothetical protein
LLHDISSAHLAGNGDCTSSVDGGSTNVIDGDDTGDTGWDITSNNTSGVG